MIGNVFYRGRGTYLVGRAFRDRDDPHPVAIALCLRHEAEAELDLDAVLIVGAIVLFPSLAVLYYVFKGKDS